MAVVLLLRFYQLVLSPMKAALFGQYACCRFHPTCSQYAIEAVRSRGVMVGAWLTLRRLGKCHPYHPGGYDPVPQSSSRSRPRAEQEMPPSHLRRMKNFQDI
jgi:uncharacterized protein